MFSKEVLISMLGGVLRITMGSISLWAIQKGIVTEEQVTLILLGLAGFLGTIIWMWMNKAKERIELLTGIASPKTTTVNELRSNIAAGAAVPVGTSDSVTPKIKKETK